MADQRNGGIAWTDETWNPIRGCSRVSAGCANCYAEQMAARFSDPGQPFHGLAKRTPDGGRWTGEVRLIEERLTDPLRWRRPRRIFVNSVSDPFHKAVTDEMRDRIFAVMALSPQHVLQVLTKRPMRMRAYIERVWGARKGLSPAIEVLAMGERYALGPWKHHDEAEWKGWPLPNVWLGVSVENQAAADERREPMRALAEAGWFTWVSSEPRLGPINWTGWEFIRWLVTGGESGPGARPMHPDWARDDRDWCAAAEVPFFFKQAIIAGKKVSMPSLDGKVWAEVPNV